jgi:hypothetical protein
MKNQKSSAIKALVRLHGEPLFKVVFDVWGEGKDKHVNPSAYTSMTYYGEDFKECKGKMSYETGGALYKVREVIDLNPAYSIAHTEWVSKMQKDQKERAV